MKSLVQSHSYRRRILNDPDFSEENKKRLNDGYGQVGFNYDQSSTTQDETTEDPTKMGNENRSEQPDEVYVPHERFYLPLNMEIVC